MDKNLLNLNISELEATLSVLGEKKFRTKQLFNWFYKRGVLDINLMSNLSPNLKKKLLDNFEIKIPQVTHVTYSSEDNSYKFLLRTHDNNLIESILMLNHKPTQYHPDMPKNAHTISKRVTLCVSSMIGCPLKCKFCATGSQLKFIRKLEASEIVGQFLAIRSYAIKNNIASRISNIVFMGMGEPLLNIENLKKSLNIFLDKDTIGISRNKITISTAGITQGLANLINKYKVRLAVSLHFPTDTQRNKFMPINKKYSIQKLITEIQKIELSKRDHITIEYLMIDKVNDTIEHAKKLIALLKNLNIKINLIPYNPTKSFLAKPSSEKQINLFAKYLVSKSIMVTVRRSKGKNIQGGCGQFALQKTFKKS